MAAHERSSLGDELSIRNLEARYCDAVNRRDAAAWSRTWSRDGVWELLGNRIEERDHIVSFWQDTMKALPMVFHTPLCGLVALQGDTARCRWYVQELIVDDRQAARRLFGVYHDECQYEAEGWLFLRRRFDLLYQQDGRIDPEKWAGKWTGFPQDMNNTLV